MLDKKVLDVTKDVKWIGILDPDLITFDVVMETKYGTTYNSYFINAEKPAIVETAKEKYWDVYLDKIKAVTDPSKIQYIIVNHTEPDHSGSVARLLDIAPDATIIGSGPAISYLGDLTGKSFKHLIAKDGMTLDLGNKTLKFISAPNLHWPDSMYTYLQEDQVLFTCDSFGAHYCHEAMFDDLVGNFDNAFTYYFNVILRPFSKFMLKAIEKIRPLEIKAVCTGHGPILRTYWKKYVDLTERYAKEYAGLPGKNRVWIAYVSAYQNTGQIAEKIAQGIRSAGNIEAEVSDIEMMEPGLMEENIMRSDAVLIGSPTINKNTLMPVYKLFAVVNPIRDAGKLAGVFGSYGWSGEAVKIIDVILKELKLKPLEEPFVVKFTPHEDGLQKSFEFGKRFGEKMISVNP